MSVDCKPLSGLKKHKRFDSEEKNTYKCDVCDYACNNINDLYTHTLVHSREKTYKCNVSVMIVTILQTVFII